MKQRATEEIRAKNKKGFKVSMDSVHGARCCTLLHAAAHSALCSFINKLDSWSYNSLTPYRAQDKLRKVSLRPHGEITS